MIVILYPVYNNINNSPYSVYVIILRTGIVLTFHKMYAGHIYFLLFSAYPVLSFTAATGDALHTPGTQAALRAAYPGWLENVLCLVSYAF